ncbi:HAUS augmin-like complex subunit 6 [Mactra antiquata]
MDIDVSMLDMKQLFFNNLLLLGFDAQSMEATNHIPFNKTMFDLPNKHGAEIVLHYLFQRLNPTMCKEAFRDCWPILDKKREQGFRKTCYNWLSNISQEEPDSHLPRVNASLFMSPGGDKFYQLLFYFSGYVLRKVMETELGSKTTERLRYPTLSQDNLQLGEVMIKSLVCSSVRHRTNYFSTAQLHMKASRVWKETADDYVKEYRKLSKEIRELDYQYREEEQKSIEAALKRGSPLKKRNEQDDRFHPEIDPRTIKRSHRIQQVRDMWKQVEDFDQNAEAEREVVESIVQKTINKYKLDASEINVKVPDMLLRECGDEIRRRNVDNTYQGGKLNLVSVLQLWSLCLHLYLEKINQVGLPNFEEDVKKLTSQAHLQQNYAQNAQTLRQQMSERIPALKASIEKLSQKLDSSLFTDKSPESIRTTSVGLGLVGPSPKPSFSPDKGQTPARGIGIQLSPRALVDTPEAINQISEQMKESVRKGPDSLFKSKDIDLHLKQPETQSSIPRRQDSKPTSRQSSRPTSARSTTSSKASGKSSVKSTSRSNKERVVRHTANKSIEDHSFTKPVSPRTMVEKVPMGDNSLVSDRHTSSPHAFHPLYTQSDKSYRSSGGSTPKGDHSMNSPRSVTSKGGNSMNSSVASGERTGQDDTLTEIRNGDNYGRKTPTDYLVDEIMGEGKILSPFNSGMEAFQARSEICRTPELDEALKHEGVNLIDLPLTEVYTSNSANNVNNNQDLNGEQFVDIKGPSLDNDENYEDDFEEESGDSSNNKCDDEKTVDKDNVGKLIDLDRDVDTSDLLTGRFSGRNTDEFGENLGINTSGLDLGDRSDLDIANRSDNDLDDRSNLYLANRGVFGLDDKSGLGLVGRSGLDLDTDTGITGIGDEMRVINDDIVETMIEEGIRQVTCDGLRDLDDGDKHDYNKSSDDEDDNIEEMIEPEIEDLSDVSQRSTEEPIVIDKSINMTPNVKSDRLNSMNLSHGSPVTLIEDEQFPSLENSPEAIVIDSRVRSPNNDILTSDPFGSSVDPWNIDMAPSGGLMSVSMQGGLLGEKTPVSTDVLSRSLVTERSPLTDEIRKMFKQALADTPPKGDRAVKRPTLSGKGDKPEQTIESNVPDYEKNFLKQTDASWDTTENIEDIELPDMSGSEDVDLDTLLQKGENLLQMKFEGLDDFFACKTPELPRRRQQQTGADRSGHGDTGITDSSVGDDGSTMWPKFPQSEADPASLISFTP